MVSPSSPALTVKDVPSSRVNFSRSETASMDSPWKYRYCSAVCTRGTTVTCSDVDFPL